MRNLDLLSAPNGRFGRRHDHGHAADRGHVELEPLPAAQPGSAYDLELGQFVVPGTHAVDGFAAETDAASEFTDCEIRTGRGPVESINQAKPDPVVGGRAERRVGVPPLARKQLRARYLAAVAALPLDAKRALGWLCRGPLATSPLFPTALRRTVLRLGGVKLGAMVNGLTRCYFESSNVSIGTGSYVNAGCWFEGAGKIEIGDDCMFGPQVLILTSTHAVGSDGEIARRSESLGVRIDDGCWICARAMILPGVRIGAGAIVAAGAVVTEDCERDGLYGGVPARRLR